MKSNLLSTALSLAGYKLATEMREFSATWQELSTRHKGTLAVAALASLALIGLSVAGEDVHPPNAVLVFLLLTLLVSATFGPRVTLVAAILSDVCLLFFFFEPIFVPWAHDTQLRLTAAIFLVVSVVIGSLFQELRPRLVTASAGAGTALAWAPATPPLPIAIPSDRQYSSPLLIDVSKHVVVMNGKEVMLTPTEFSLLQYFAVNVGKILTHQEILANVWGEEYGKDSQILRAYVKQLRFKLGDDPASPRFIRTETRLGYRFMNPGAEFLD